VPALRRSVCGCPLRPSMARAGKSAKPSQRVAREDDCYDVCHTDVIKCMVISDHGLIFTGG